MADSGSAGAFIAGTQHEQRARRSSTRARGSGVRAKGERDGLAGEQSGGRLVSEGVFEMPRPPQFWSAGSCIFVSNRHNGTNCGRILFFLHPS
jgi:hypothetical protein